MNDRPKFRIPLILILLDIIGGLFLAFGIAETVNPGIFLPPALAFPFYSWIPIIIGPLLMLPLVLHMVGLANNRTRQRPAEYRYPNQPLNHAPTYREYEAMDRDAMARLSA